MPNERHVRLFRNGRNQALRIPREFEFEGDEAILRKERDRLIVEPVRKGRLLALLRSLPPLTVALRYLLDTNTIPGLMRSPAGRSAGASRRWVKMPSAPASLLPQS